jgi:hypothetical protein
MEFERRRQEPEIMFLLQKLNLLHKKITKYFEIQSSFPFCIVIPVNLWLCQGYVIYKWFESLLVMEVKTKISFFITKFLFW